jgi:hypothetical protein
MHGSRWRRPGRRRARALRGLPLGQPHVHPQRAACRTVEVLRSEVDRSLSQACREREQGLCNITVAPLFGAQDGEISDLRFCASKRGAEWIEVRFKNFGKDEVIAFRMTKTRAGWRISDLVYEDAGSLVEALSQPLQ